MTPDRDYLETRRRELGATINSPALVSDARAGDRDAADTLAAAREELGRVQRALAQSEATQ